MTKRWFKASAVLGTMTATSLVFMTPAFADTTSFNTQYQAKLAQEQSLLSQAQALNSTDSNVVALIATAQSINTQVATLYPVEQSLASGASSIPQIHVAHPKETKELQDLQVRRSKLLKQSSDAWKLVVQYSRHPHKKGLLHKAIAEHNAIGKQVAIVNKQISDLKKKLNAQDWEAHPYDGGLAGIRDSILRLENAAIHYTNEAITLENSNSSSGTTTTSSGISNSTTGN